MKKAVTKDDTPDVVCFTNALMHDFVVTVFADSEREDGFP